MLPTPAQPPARTAPRPRRRPASPRSKPGSRSTHASHASSSRSDDDDEEHSINNDDDDGRDVDVELGFELEEEWAQPASTASSRHDDWYDGCTCSYPYPGGHATTTTMRTVSASSTKSALSGGLFNEGGSGIAPLPASYTPVMPIIVPDLPPTVSSTPSHGSRSSSFIGDTSPSLAPTGGLIFARRSSSTAGGAPTPSSSSSSSYLPSSAAGPSQITTRMNRSMSIQHQPGSLDALSSGAASRYASPYPYDAATSTAAPPSATATESIPIPFTGVGRRRSRTGPPAPHQPTPLIASPSRARTSHSRQPSASSAVGYSMTESPRIGLGHGYGYSIGAGYLCIERNAMGGSPAHFQSTPLPQGEFRRPPLPGLSPSLTAPGQAGRLQTRLPPSAAEQDGDGSPPFASTSKAAETLPQPPPSMYASGASTSTRAISAACSAALGTSAPSHHGTRDLGTVGSAPLTTVSTMTNGYEPDVGAARFLFRAPLGRSRSRSSGGGGGGGSKNDAALPSHDDEDGSAGRAGETDTMPSLRLAAAPYQRAYASSSELNVVGEDDEKDEHENEEEEEGREGEVAMAVGGRRPTFGHAGAQSEGGKLSEGATRPPTTTTRLALVGLGVVVVDPDRDRHGHEDERGQASDEEEEEEEEGRRVGAMGRQAGSVPQQPTQVTSPTRDTPPYLLATANANAPGLSTPLARHRQLAG